jgi:hypothetical protein
MQFYGKLNREKVTVAITVETRTPQKIYVNVVDEAHKDTVYCRRFATINGKETFYIRFPQSPKVAIFSIKSEAQIVNPSTPDNFIIKVDKKPLKTKLEAFDNANPKIKKFVKFAQEFSESAGRISSNQSVYTDDDCEFNIQYVDTITLRNGTATVTPARISGVTGDIEVAAKYFVPLTVPQRMAVLLHEFSHFFLNTDMKNEEEADANALMIYLGLGYPRLDGITVFTKMLVNNPTDDNADRVRKVKQFISDFDSKFVSMSYDKEQLNRMKRNKPKEKAA